MKIDYRNYSENTCQEDRQSEPLALEAFVRLITDKWTSKPPKEKNLNNAIYAQTTILKKEHNSSAFFIKLNLQQNRVSIAEQWKEVKEKIRLIVEKMTKEFMVVGGILSIEMHKNTSKTNKRGTNSKAGYPHLLLMLWITHAELDENIEENLRRSFLALDFEVEVKAASTRKNIKKYLTYTIKEAADPDLIGFCKQYLQLPATTMVWACHSECRNIFEEIQKSLNRTRKKYSSFLEEIKKTSFIPTTKEEKNKDIILAQIFHKLFEERDWAVYLDKIYRRQYERRFTWEEYGGLDVWLTRPDKEYNDEQIEKLKTLVSLKVITNKVTNKDSFFIQENLFPRLIIEKNFIEFEEGVYNFETGRMEREKISPLTWCINDYPGKYEELKPPYRELGVMYLLANKGQDTVIVDEIGNEFVWNALKYTGYGLKIRDALEEEVKAKSTCGFSWLKTDIKIIEIKKEMTIVIKKDVWEEIKKEVSTNIKKWAIEVDNEYIYMRTSLAFSVLVNSIFLEGIKKKDIGLPERWYKGCKPNEEEKEIEEIGLNCFQYIMRKKGCLK